VALRAARRRGGGGGGGVGLGGCGMLPVGLPATAAAAAVVSEPPVRRGYTRPASSYIPWARRRPASLPPSLACVIHHTAMTDDVGLGV